MAESYTLAAETRTVTGKKVGALRRSGLVPAVIYGSKITPIHLQVPYRELEVTLAKAGGTHLIDVNVSGATQTVLARSVQRDAIRGRIIHVDFYAIDRSVKITTEVPVHLTGESPAVGTRVGVLQQDMLSLELEALPGDLIDRVDVDVSGLAHIGDVIHIKDLNLPSGVTALADAEAVVVRINAPRIVTEDDTTAAEATSAEPELVERKRGDDFED